MLGGVRGGGGGGGLLPSLLAVFFAEYGGGFNSGGSQPSPPTAEKRPYLHTHVLQVIELKMFLANMRRLIYIAGPILGIPT